MSELLFKNRVIQFLREKGIKIEMCTFVPILFELPKRTLWSKSNKLLLFQDTIKKDGNILQEKTLLDKIADWSEEF